MGRLRVHLRRIRPVETEHVAREFRHRDMHPEANAEVRNRPFTRDPAREDLPLPPTRAEAARDEYAVHLLEQRRGFVVRHVFRVDPAHMDATAVMRARMLQGLVRSEEHTSELQSRQYLV